MQGEHGSGRGGTLPGPASGTLFGKNPLAGRLAGLFLGLVILSFHCCLLAMVVVEREEAIKKMLKIYIAELLHNTCYVG